MNWQDVPIPEDEEGNPRFKGLLKLVNDKREHLGGICWFYDEGPFYSSAMDVNDTTLVRRIGPCSTLEGAKQSVFDAIEGLTNISDRASYLRSEQ
jgi:hypothetical protein